MTAAFDAAFKVLIGEEGGFQKQYNDPGNWTGGKVGAGTLVGTKYGIAAHAHPKLDIASLTLDQAKQIYFDAYWTPTCCHLMPGPLALVHFDAAVNSGPTRAMIWLQGALGVTADGKWGPVTEAALERASGHGSDLLQKMLTQRVAFLARLPGWSSFALGWCERIVALPFRAMTMPTT